MSRWLFLMCYPSNEGVSRSEGRILTFLCSSTPMRLCQHAAQGQGCGWGRGGRGRLHLSDIELLGFIWGMVWQDKPNKQSRGVNWSLLQVRWVRGTEVRGRMDKKRRNTGGEGISEQLSTGVYLAGDSTVRLPRSCPEEEREKRQRILA